FGMIKWTM
ncbi:orf483.CDS.1, partial (mitochondrion) [Saccharomyces cerevisiae]